MTDYELEDWLPEDEEDSEDDLPTIRCIGIDNKHHLCHSWNSKTICGVPVKRKNLLPNDHELFSCYECTF